MPNTLAHIGIQGLATRSLMANADFKWIYVGCIIPDFPWILRRVVNSVYSGIDSYDLLLYFTIQSTFCFCVILSAALAIFSANYWKIFFILSFNSFLHLVLDACQTKLANGVHLLAPFNWHLVNFGFFWPESLPAYFLTIIGFVYLVWNWRSASLIAVNVTFRPAMRFLIIIAFITAYFTIPFFLLDYSEDANNHFVRTLRTPSNRPGQQIELDRDPYFYHQSGGTMRTSTGEELDVSGIKLDHSATVSVKGEFVTENLIHVKQYHVHSNWFRDCSSYLGLILVSILYFYTLVRQKFFKGDMPLSPN